MARKATGLQKRKKDTPAAILKTMKEEPGSARELDLRIVGIGASAGGLVQCRKFSHV